jgi:peptidase M28-like protein
MNALNAVSKKLIRSVPPVVVIVATAMLSGHAQTRQAAPALRSPLPALHPMDEQYMEWPLRPEDKMYAAIDGRHLKQYVGEAVAIAERYRDQGHQFWGRITGTSADVDTQQWVLNKFKQIGLTDIRTQPHALAPQWIPQSWEVTASGSGKTLRLESAQPTLITPATPPGGLDLEAVYAGTASDADFAGRDVRGKAVFIYSTAHNHGNYAAMREGGAKRAEEKGAAAIFIIFAIPGNLKMQLYPTGNRVPTFCLGLDDGLAVRDLIGQSPGGTAVRVKVRLDAPMVPNLTTATLWGTLPGATDEKIYIVAHRDGVFDGAVDNGSGMATMLGLAEYFARLPKAQRQRTIVFVSVTGHHNNCTGGSNPCTISGLWITEHHEELFRNTALLINCEHTATSQTSIYDPDVRTTTATSEALFWYAGGSDRVAQISYNAYRAFGVPIYSQPEAYARGEIGQFAQFTTSVQLVNLGLYSHSDKETLEVVPWTGLQAVTRAFAKIIADVNTLSIKELQRPAGTQH